MRKFRLRHRFHHHSLQIASILLYSILASAVLLVTGCGGSGSPAKTRAPLSIAPTITTQPASQTMLLGRSATFTVAATGTAPLSYQWYRNSVEVSNGNTASLVTPIVTAADNGTIYSVRVTNAAGSVTSTQATLLTGPRAPAIGDYRYLMSEQIPSGFNYPGGGPFLLGDSMGAFSGDIGEPLYMGLTIQPNPGAAALCTWATAVFSLPQNYSYLTTSYAYGQTNRSTTSEVSQYLQSLNAPNSIIFSMDIRPTCGDNIGVAYLQFSSTGSPPGTSGYDQRIEVIDPSNLQAQVAADGAQSRIVTAASFNDSTGKIVLLSYGWQGDTTTAYEATSFLAQPKDMLADDAQLANQGYFISAFGGNNHDGYIIVGMRVMGDVTPRPYTLDGYDSNNNPIKQTGNQPTYPDLMLYTPVTVDRYPYYETLSGFAEQ